MKPKSVGKQIRRAKNQLSRVDQQSITRDSRQGEKDKRKDYVDSQILTRKGKLEKRIQTLKNIK